jgi:hypothetical protein
VSNSHEGEAAEPKEALGLGEESEDFAAAKRSGGDVELTKSGGDVEFSGGDVEATGTEGEDSGGDVESEPTGDDA